MKKLIFILNIIFLPTLWAEDLNSLFSESGNLTDEQVTQSKDFVHAGIKDKIIQEGCKDINNCQMEDDNGIENIIGKVYATALPAVLGQIKTSGGDKAASSDKATGSEKTTGTKKAAGAEKTAGTDKAAGADKASGADKAAGTDNAANPEKKEDGTDWCMITAMGYEMFSTLFQEKLQKSGSKSEQQIPDAQLRSLVNLRETHKARKKSATYQATAYGTVTACYVAMMTLGNMSFDWKVGVKLGGAALLTTLYMKKAQKHDKLAGKVQKVIDALPKTGECNPWTQSACFCQEQTSRDLYPAEYQEVCVLNNGNFDTTKMAMGCAATDSTGKISYDEKCNCKATNSCLSARISAFTPNLSGATNAMNQMKAGYDLLDSGLYDEAKLNKYSTQAAAMGSSIARKATNPDSQPVNLTNDQKKLAQELAGVVAPELAAQIASAQPQFPENSIANTGSSGSMLSAVDKKEEGLKANAVKAGYKAKGSSNSYESSEEGFVMPTMAGAKNTVLSGSEVINFADRAVNNADVNNSPDKPIFDIISNRYRHAWKRLDEKAQSLE